MFCIIFPEKNKIMLIFRMKLTGFYKLKKTFAYKRIRKNFVKDTKKIVYCQGMYVNATENRYQNSDQFLLTSILFQ